MSNKRVKGRLFDHPSDMEPLLPEDREGQLAGLALMIIRKADRLRGSLHPVTRKSVAGLVRSMNSYYSNLIEGHRTTPRDIDAALTKHFSKNLAQRSLQILHLGLVLREIFLRGEISRGEVSRIVRASPR